MKRHKVKIVLLFGGRSAEHEVSLSSAAAIYRNVNRSKFEVTSVYIDKTGRWRKVASPLLPREQLAGGRTFSFLPWDALHSLPERFQADIYFPVLHGPHGEDGTVQGIFEMADVPYVGAGVLGSAVGMDKAVMKALFAERGLPIVKFRAYRQADWRNEQKALLRKIGREFALPFFVKPANLGSSVGISKVKARSQTKRALSRAFCFDRKVLIEEGIEGREIECSVIGNENPRASLPGEVIPHREFYDYRDKYVEGKTMFRIPAELPAPVIRRVQRLAIETFLAAECSGMARIDFFLEDGSGKLYVNEINTIPGFTEISMYPKLWGVSGLPFDRLIEELIRLGLERHSLKKRRLERKAQ